MIVGAGVYGCALAYELACAGHGVLVLERGGVACGASGGLGKRGVRANERDPRELPLMRMAYEMWPTLAATLGAPTGYARVGHLLVAERDQDLESLPARALAQNRLGVPTEWVGGADLSALEPGLTSAARAGLHCPLDGIADHGATTRAYAAAARSRGAEIREGVTVEALEIDGTRVRAVRLDDGERVIVDRAVAILANHAGAGLVHRSFGVALPVWQTLPQVMRTGPMDRPPVRGLVGHASRVVSIKVLEDGAVMVSGGWRGRWNRARKAGETVPERVAGNWAEAVALFPSLEEHAVAEASADRHEGICIDGIPIVDRVAGSDNCFIGAGWCGHGWAIAPAVSHLLAGWMREGVRPALLAPFTAARFC